MNPSSQALCAWSSSIYRPIPNQLNTSSHWSQANSDNHNHFKLLHWSCVQPLHPRIYEASVCVSVQDLIRRRKIVYMLQNVFFAFLQCVWFHLKCENGQIRVNRGRQAGGRGFLLHSSWMLPSLVIHPLFKSDTSFHRMTGETFSSAHERGKITSAVMKSDETDGIFPCEQVYLCKARGMSYTLFRCSQE